MATLDEKITRVENNIAASLEAAAEMGAEVPEGANSNNLPNLIRSIPKGGGASSWNDLPDRPVVMSGGDTLTWDGKTDGLYGVDVNGNGSLMFYHISDAAPSMGDFASGFSLGVIGYDGSAIEQTFEQTAISEMAPGFCVDAGFNVAIVQEDNMDAGGIIFEKKGVYFAVSPTQFTASITIPGYTGFATEKFDPAYLYQPDWEQTDETAPDFVKNKPFGETVELVDKLTWDGTPSNIVAADMYHLISSTVLTKSDCGGGCSYALQIVGVDTPMAEEIAGTELEAMFADDGLGMISDGMIMVIPYDNYTIEGFVFPQAGIYFAGNAQMYISEFAVNGFSSFEKRTIKTLAAKFIPVNDLPMGVGKQNEWGEIFNVGQHMPNQANGMASHAEGSGTEANGDISHAEGSETKANGEDSHAEGYCTEANGMISHAEGSCTIANGNSQHVHGAYNEPDPDADPDNDPFTRGRYIHIVGNGTEGNRSNAHTLDWDGNAWFQGKIYLGGSGQDDEEAAELKGLPAYTEADEGKVLKIVNGAPAWVSIPNAEEASF